MKSAIHIFQRSVGGVVIFYTLQDYLVYYTIFSVYAQKHGLQVLGLAIMYNHLHILIVGGDRKKVRRFMTVVTSVFARQYNEDSGLSGEVFQHSFGSSVKYGEKEIRTTAGYLYNNHTNNRLCTETQNIRWNFLAFAHSEHPFSAPIILRKARICLRRAIKNVNAAHSRGDYLNYASLKRIFKGLNKEEKEQIVDYIIGKYNIIDYKALESLYSSYEEMIYSFNANTHHDYKIPEGEDDRKSDDRFYQSFSKIVLSSGKVSSLKGLLLLSEDSRLRLALKVQMQTGAPLKQICAFFRVRIEYEKLARGGQPPDSQPFH
ncbi:MAG: transposase [Bacteroidales bacterium]|nr:transposase [Bacteroidales bacterium]